MIFHLPPRGTRTSSEASAHAFSLQQLEDMARGISKHSWNIHVKAQAHEVLGHAILDW